MCAWGKPKGPSFTTKLRRWVHDLKRKRNGAIAAHHSATIYPLFPSLSSHKPSQSPSSHHLTSHISSPTSLTTSPLQSTISSPPTTAHSHPIHIRASCPATIAPQASPLNSSRSPSNPCPILSTAALHQHCGKHLAQRVLWAAPLFALLGTFLCIGKEIAFVGVVAAHLILWLALRLGLPPSGSNVKIINHTSPHCCLQEEEDSIAEENGRTRPSSHSLTVQAWCRRITFTESLQWNRRSKSWAKIDSSVEDEGQLGAASDSYDCASGKCSGVSLPQRDSLCRAEAASGAAIGYMWPLPWTYCGSVYGCMLHFDSLHSKESIFKRLIGNGESQKA